LQIWSPKSVTADGFDQQNERIRVTKSNAQNQAAFRVRRDGIKPAPPPGKAISLVE
jgi:hypothetical protein